MPHHHHHNDNNEDKFWGTVYAIVIVAILFGISVVLWMPLGSVIE